MLCLCIDVQSIELKSKLIEYSDKVRVSITTQPEEQKQAEVIDAKYMKEARPSFKIQFQDTTEKIIFIFRKQNYTEKDPIVATTTIRTEDITKIYKEGNRKDSKKVDLYECTKHTKNYTGPQPNRKPKVIGHIEMNFTVRPEKTLLDIENSKNAKKSNELANNNSHEKENECYLLKDRYTN